METGWHGERGRGPHERARGDESLMGNATVRNGSVLVIDDEEIMREILETLLTREGYDVRLASSGAEGVELAKILRTSTSPSST